MKRRCKSLLSITLGLALVLGGVLLLKAQAVAAQAAPDQAQVISAGLAYLKSQQQPDGGITGFSGAADPDTTARSVMAYIAAGKPISEAVSQQGNSMLDYLASQAITFTHDTTRTLFPGRAGELLAAVSLAGKDPKTFGGMDLVSELGASLQADSGAYSTSAKQDYASGAASDLNQAWAILGLSLAGEAVPGAAAQYLVGAQGTDGSWGAGDPDTTALAMTALLASHAVDRQSAPIQKAIGYFHATQADSGGWKPSWDTDPLNADSTGWIIQALVSAGEDVRGGSWMKNNTNPVDALLALQKPDGAIGGSYANTYSTAEAVIGLAGIPLATYEKALAESRAGLAIFSSDNSVVTKCITFTGSISGLDLLKLSGLPIETATNPTQGTAVCKIGDVGDAANNCFGSMPNYWSYWVLGNAGWEYSPQGAEQSKVVDRGVYAWEWGPGNAPATLSFQNICEGVAFVLPTTTPAATEAALASPTAAQVPSQAPAQPTAAAVTSTAPVGTSTGTYIIYAVILLVLSLLIIILIRRRSG